MEERSDHPLSVGPVALIRILSVLSTISAAASVWLARTLGDTRNGHVIMKRQT